MSEHELEQALRRALRPVEPGEGFADRVVARLEASAAGQMGRSDAAVTANVMPTSAVSAARHGRRRAFGRWAPLAVAACAITAIGLVRWRQEALGRQRGVEARAQLLQALNIASANVNAVRVAVVRAEGPPP